MSLVGHSRAKLARSLDRGDSRDPANRQWCAGNRENRSGAQSEGWGERGAYGGRRALTSVSPLRGKSRDGSRARASRARPTFTKRQRHATLASASTSRAPGTLSVAVGSSAVTVTGAKVPEHRCASTCLRNQRPYKRARQHGSIVQVDSTKAHHRLPLPVCR